MFADADILPCVASGGCKDTCESDFMTCLSIHGLQVEAHHDGGSGRRLLTSKPKHKSKTKKHTKQKTKKLTTTKKATKMVVKSGAAVGRGAVKTTPKVEDHVRIRSCI